MGLKESGLRGSLRNVSVGIDAIPDSVVDDFERGDLDPYSGDLGSFGVTQTNVPEGDFALEIDDASAEEVIYSEPDDGLDYYPQKGDVFVCLLKDPDEDYRPKFFWGLSNNGGVSGYSVRLAPDSGGIRISEWDDGSQSTIADTSINHDGDTWYWMEVEWHDGSADDPEDEIVATLYDVDVSKIEDDPAEARGNELGSTSVNDDNHANNRGVGFGVGSTGDATGSMADWYVKLFDVGGSL